jgi:prophage DNA circulation protein
MSRHEQLQAAYARRDTAVNRIANIRNDTLILNRQITEAQAIVDALHDEWNVLQEADTAARIDARAANEEIRRLTENNAMGGSRRNRTRRRSRK